MVVLALDLSPVAFTLTAWLFLNILLGFYNRRSICYNESPIASNPYIGPLKCYSSFIVLSITLGNVYYYFHSKYEQLRLRVRGCGLLIVLDPELKHSFSLHWSFGTWGLYSLLPKVPPCSLGPSGSLLRWRECGAQEQRPKAWKPQAHRLPFR